MPDNMKCCRCCGSSLGWLIMIDDTMEVILFNPFSGNTITFPPIRNLVFEKLCELEYEDIRRLSMQEEYGEEELEMAFDLEDDDEIQGEEKAHEEEGRQVYMM